MIAAAPPGSAPRPRPAALALIAIAILVYFDAFSDIGKTLPAVLAVLVILLGGPWWLHRRGRTAWTGHLALVALSSLVALALAEVVFRAAFVEHRVPTNPREFQSVIAADWPRPISEEKPPGTFRILGLADSFGRAGKGSNYHYLVERALRDAGHEVEVVNISVGSYALTDELEALRRVGAHYRPDLVLHGFYVGNDFGIPVGTAVRCRGIPFRTQSGILALRPRHLVFANWFRRFARAYDDARQRRAEARRNQRTGVFAKASFDRIAERRRPLFLLDPPPAERWAATAPALDRIRAAAEGMGAAYVLVVHPDRFQVETALRGDLEATYRTDAARHDFDAPQAFIRDYCAARGVHLVDLLPAFREHGAGGGLYRFRDTHYDEAGNRLAAGEIARYLLDRGLVGSP